MMEWVARENTGREQGTQGLKDAQLDWTAKMTKDLKVLWTVTLGLTRPKPQDPQAPSLPDPVVQNGRNRVPLTNTPRIHPACNGGTFPREAHGSHQRHFHSLKPASSIFCTPILLFSFFPFVPPLSLSFPLFFSFLFSSPSSPPSSLLSFPSTPLPCYSSQVLSCCCVSLSFSDQCTKYLLMRLKTKTSMAALSSGAKDCTTSRNER